MQSITLQTNDSIVSSGDPLGQVQFAASNELDAGASRYIVGRIYSEAEGSFTSSANPASLVFATSAADNLPASGKIKISHEGHILPLLDNTYDLGSPDLRFRDLYVTSEVTSPSGNFDQLFFNTSIGDIDQVAGQLNWNSEAGTLELGLTDDLKIQVGQTVLFRVKNSTGSALSKGQAVYASGVLGGGQIIQAAKFAADESVDEVRFIGLMTDDLANGEDGFVNHFGHIKNVDLRTSNTAVNPNGETWAVGDILYVDDSTPGGLTKVPPQDDIYVALVLEDGQNGELFVRITDPGHMTDLHDVNFSGLVDNNLMVWNSGSDYWEPSSGLYFVDGDLGIGTTSPNATLHVYNSTPSGTIFNAEGTNGSLFSVVDNLSGVLMSVNTIAGLPVLEVNSDYSITAGRFNQNDFVLTSSGDIGMGIAAPSGKLHVVGEVYVDNLKLDGNTLSSTDSNGNIYITPNGTGGVAGGSSTTVTSSYGTVGGGFGNISSGGSWSTVGGGRQNTASNNYTTIGGGCGNCANTLAATVAGGFWNKACGSYASVGGGRQNTASGGCSVVAGGISNTASGPYSSVLGGQSNSAGGGGRSAVVNGYGSSACYFSFVGNGYISKAHGNVSSVTTGCYNYACADFSSIVGGASNEIKPSGTFSFIGGGCSNLICGNESFYGTIGGGCSNKICGANSCYATIAGGWSNIAIGQVSTIAGGSSNQATSYYSFIGGGTNNISASSWTVVTGGRSNCAGNGYAFIGGGCQNCTNCNWGTIAGGANNCVSNCYGFVGGGTCNTSSGLYAGIVAGSGNLSAGTCSFIGGGVCHTASGITSFIGGGLRNTTSGYYNVVVGGSSNRVYNWFSAIGGGKSNTASCYYSTIAGGWANTVLGGGGFIGAGISNDIGGVWGGVIGGGADNTVSASYGIVVGGCCNTINASGACSFIGGGCRNTSSGAYSAILGGKNNSDGGCSSVFILGTGITATSANTTYTQKLNVSHTIEPSGTLFNVEGSNGSLFSVVDNLSGVLMSVNNNAGLPVFEVYDDDSIIAGRFAQNDFVIASNGDIGMGIAAPSGKLHVVGDSYFNDTIYIHATGVATSYTYNKIYAHPTYDHLILQGGGNTITLGGQSGHVSIDASSTFIDIGNGYNAGTTNQYIRFTPANTEAMRITNAGDVGIGTASPGYKLHVAGDISANANNIYGGGFAVYGDTNNKLTKSGNDFTLSAGQTTTDVHLGYYDGGTLNKVLTVDSSEDRVGILNTTPDYTLDVTGSGNFTGDLYASGNIGIGTNSLSHNFVINKTGKDPDTAMKSSSGSSASMFDEGGSLPGLLIGMSSSNSYTHRGSVYMNRSRGTLDSPQAVQDGDWLGSYYGAGYDGSALRRMGGVIFVVDGAVSAGNVPTSIMFQTGSSSRTEKMRITHDGKLGIGTSSPAYTLDVNGTSNLGGDVIVGGNLTVNGTTISTNVDTIEIQDPIITLGLTSGNIVTDDSYDRGVAMVTNDGTAFMGWDNSADKFVMLSSGVATNSSGNYDPGTWGQLDTGANVIHQAINNDINGGLIIKSANDTYTHRMYANSYDLKLDSNGSFYIGIANATSRNLYINSGGSTAWEIGRNGIRNYTSGSNSGAGIYARYDGYLGFNGIGSTYDHNAISLHNRTGHYDWGLALHYRASGIGVGLTKGLVLDNRGRVGINDETPSYQLDVNGTTAITPTAATESLILGRNTGYASVVSTASNELILDSDSAYVSLNHYSSDDVILGYGGGNVGIGTASPARGLVINKSGPNAAMEVYKTDTGRKIAYIGTGSSAATDTAIIQLYDNSTEHIRLYTVGNSWINGGNLGVGTASPTQKLHIASSAAADLLIKVEQDNASYPCYSEFNSQDGGYARFGIASDANDFAFFNTDQASYRWLTTGTERMRLTSGGNVGIGTSSPSTKFEVFSAGYFSVDPAANPLIYIKNNTATNSTAGTAELIFKQAANSAGGKIVSGRDGLYVDGASRDSNLQFYTSTDASDTEKMRITTAGNVGIGTTSPLAKMHIQGSGYQQGLLIERTDTSSKWGLAGLSSGGFQIWDDNQGDATRFVINSSGNVGIGTDTPGSKLSIYDGSLAGNYFTIRRGGGGFDFKLDAGGNVIESVGKTCIIGPIDAQVLRLKTNDTTRVHITSDGLVGINTVAPTTQLDVNGVITATGGNSNEWNQAYDWGNHASAGYVTLTGVQTLTNKTLHSPNIVSGVFQDTFTIGSQIFYEQGTNGFSVNEDFDPSNSSTQTAYHFTTGSGRETLAFTLARTSQFTDGFGIYGTASDNTFVTFGEQSNTKFEWRKGIGIRPLDLDGGTLLMRLNTNGNLDVSGSGIFGSGIDINGAADFSSTINAPNLGAGEDNSVVILDSDGKLRTDEIDSRVWGSSLVDGTGSASGVAFWTDSNTLSNDSALIWDSTNNRLGIGTASPSTKLHIYDNNSAGYNGTSFRVENPASSSNTYFDIAIGTSTGYNDNVWFKRNGVNVAGIYNNNMFYHYQDCAIRTDKQFRAESNSNAFIELLDGSNDTKIGYLSDLRFYSSAVEKMVLDVNGNLGIGTSSPDLKTHILHSDANNGLLLEHSAQANGYQYLLNIRENEGLIFQKWTNGSYTSNVMTLDYDGDVGIGTTSPTEKLDIRYPAGGGMALLKSTDTTDGLLFGDMAYSSDNSYQGIKHAAMTGPNDYMMISNGGDTIISAANTYNTLIRAGGNNTTGEIKVRSTEVVINDNSSSSDFRVESNNNANMLFVDGVSDLVGIGTGSPSRTLHVKSSSTSNPNVAVIESSDTTTYKSFLRFKDPGTTSTTTEPHIGSQGDDFVINTANSESVRVDSNGYVGIGTASPSTQLDVIGSGNFTGDVTIDGHLSAATKSFYIDHPTKEGKLQYGSLESPYHGVRLTGRGKIEGGKCVVDLPDYISALVRDDENINIQLTNYRHSKTLYVDEINIANNEFTVKCDSWFGNNGHEFFWSFTAVRKDVQELKVEC